MPGSTDGLQNKTRSVVGVGGSYIGEFPVAVNKDMDPTNRIVYILIGHREYPAAPKNDGSCRLLSSEATERARRLAYRES